MNAQSPASDSGKGGGSFWTLKRRKSSGIENVEHPPFVPTLPTVNLVPESVRDSVRAGKIVRRFALAGVLVLAAVVGVWFLQSSQIADATARLDAAQAENMQIKAKVNELAPVKQMYTQITGLQGVVTTTLAAQPEARAVLAHLEEATARASVGKTPIELMSVSVVYSGIPSAGGTSSCPNPDPFTTELSIGCITFSATAGNREDVSAFLRSLEADSFFIGPYVASTTLGGSETEGITFSGTTAVSLGALTTPLTDEQVRAILTPPTASATAAPEAQS